MAVPEEFYQHLQDTEGSFKTFTDLLVKDALKQGTYKKAITWLGKKKPEPKYENTRTANELIEDAFMVCFNDAISEIYKRALNQKINTEDLEDGRD